MMDSVRLFRARLRRKYSSWRYRRAHRRLTRSRRQRILIEQHAEEHETFPLGLTLYWIAVFIWTGSVRRVFP